MTFAKTTLVAFGIMAAGITPIAAQSADIDINGDGMYSIAELQAYLPDMSEDTFAVLDTSGDGLLDADEISAGVSAGLLPS